jgi:aromatase
MRTNPILDFTSRGVEKAFDITVKDDKEIERTYHIPEGRMVFPLTTQATEAFPHPERFDPVANFVNNEKMARIYATPFGLGPRTCVGRFLAEAELRAVLVALMKDYTLQIPLDAPYQTAQQVPRKFVVLTQVNGKMPLNLVPRHK